MDRVTTNSKKIGVMLGVNKRLHNYCRRYATASTLETLTVLSYLAEDIEFVFADVPKISFYRSRRGRDSVAELFASMGDHQEPNGAVDIWEIIVQGNKAAVFGHASFHVKSTDRDWESDFAHMWTVEGGKLTRFQEYADTAAMSAAY